MIQDHVVDESTLKEYMELCGKLAEAASDKTVTDDAVTTRYSGRTGGKFIITIL